MTYLIDFFHILKKAAGYYPLQCILLILIFILIFILKKLYYYENKNVDFKIYNKFSNLLQCSVYIFVFILLLIYLRYLRWGLTLELLPIYYKWVDFFQKVSFLFCIICILLLMLAILIFIIIKKHLVRELWKRHLYFYFKSYNKTIKRLYEQKINPLTIPLEKEYSFYNYFINKISAYWSYKSVIGRIQHNLILKPCNRIKFFQTNYKNLYKISDIFLNIIPITGLIIIFLWELYYSNFVLHIIFYYLPFYFIYSLWKTSTNFLKNTDKEFNFVIFERYYEEDNVLYVNTTDEEDDIILGYIKRGFICYTKDLHPTHNAKEWDFMVTFITIFQNKRRFVKNNSTGIFENPSTGDSFDVKNATFIP